MSINFTETGLELTDDMRATFEVIDATEDHVRVTVWNSFDEGFDFDVYEPIRDPRTGEVEYEFVEDRARAAVQDDLGFIDGEDLPGGGFKVRPSADLLAQVKA